MIKLNRLGIKERLHLTADIPYCPLIYSEGVMSPPEFVGDHPQQLRRRHLKATRDQGSN